MDPTTPEPAFPFQPYIPDPAEAQRPPEPYQLQCFDADGTLAAVVREVNGSPVVYGNMKAWREVGVCAARSDQ